MTTADSAASTASLRRRICETAERVTRLDAERAALEELRYGLELSERELTNRLAAVRREQADLTARTAERTQRVREIDDEIATTQLEVEVLERRCTASTRAMERMTREAETLASRVRDGDRSTDEETLQSMQSSIDRMRRKLQSASRKP